MGDLFDDKNLKPMLIGAESEPFDSEDCIFELKLDGERCIAFLDRSGTELRNKRNVKMLLKVPELSEIHKFVKNKCILDGELVIIKNGVPVFSEIQARSLMSNKFKIELESKKSPATFVAYDILYYKNKQTTDLTLVERKKILQKVVKEENERFAISRIIEEKGIALYNIAKQKNLEGIVAKKKDSKYYFDKRTKDWIKIKYLKDDDFVICGYIIKSPSITSLVLGQYQGDELIYKGHVSMGISKLDFKTISSQQQKTKSPFHEYPVDKGSNNEVIWIKPELVCTVAYMEKTETGGMRQPVYRGLRKDKIAKECFIV